ncbi:hypothetical protein RJT34_28705 [Clitoria ternatea]|uniref:Uncharacterized protein n=1 Tax=Clitoria ternatea TaxID=43366 RepID=A0AAN9IBP0_CLITE
MLRLSYPYFYLYNFLLYVPFTPTSYAYLSSLVHNASSEHFVCFAVPEKEVEAVAEALQFVFYSALNVRRLS